MAKIKIKSRGIEVIAELNSSETARKVYNALPIKGMANRWGDEIYFHIGVDCDEEKDAKEIVEKGDLAYWIEGSCFCIFFGRTPASKGGEIRAASKVNVFGRVIGDSDIFKKLEDGDLVLIEVLKR